MKSHLLIQKGLKNLIDLMKESFFSVLVTQLGTPNIIEEVVRNLKKQILTNCIITLNVPDCVIGILNNLP